MDGSSQFLHPQQQAHIAGDTAGKAINLHLQEPKNFDIHSCEQGGKKTLKPNTVLSPDAF